jgi:hypothetical protein
MRNKENEEIKMEIAVMYKLYDNVILWNVPARKI